MVIYPAIDLKDGCVVRLKQGDFSREMVYSSDPVKQAEIFQQQGATWLHLVDLDGARDGKGKNAAIVEEIKRKTSLHIQLGGGIRTNEQMAEWFERGIDRLIIGTLAVENQPAVRDAIRQFGTERIVVSIDAKDGKVMTHGWVQESGCELMAFARKMAECGVSQILYTDVSRDGMLAGPDLVHLQELVEFGRETGLKVIASGGVGSYADVARLRQIKVEGVIIGQAIYQGLVSLPATIQLAR